MPDLNDNDDDFSDMDQLADQLYSQDTGGGSEDASQRELPLSGSSPQPQSSPDSSPGTAPSTQAPPGVSQAKWDSMPLSWKKDYEKQWPTLPPELRQYIHQREDEQLKGISQYKQVADRWNQTFSPYEQVFKHYGLDPSEAFRKLADAHLVLKYGDPQQRSAFARQVIEDYNLGEFIQQNGQPLAAPVDPRFMSRLDSLESTIQEQRRTENMGKVEKFFSNPENEFAVEVSEDMMELLKVGAAQTLEQAYEKAIWNNPATRAKLLQREVEKVTTPKRPAPRNVRSSGVPPAPTGQQSQSIDDTLNEVYDRIHNR